MSLPKSSVPIPCSAAFTRNFLASVITICHFETWKRGPVKTWSVTQTYLQLAHRGWVSSYLYFLHSSLSWPCLLMTCYAIAHKHKEFPSFPTVYYKKIVYAPSQWEPTLQRNVVSHWLRAYTKWSLVYASTNRTIPIESSARWRLVTRIYVINRVLIRSGICSTPSITQVNANQLSVYIVHNLGMRFKLKCVASVAGTFCQNETKSMKRNNSKWYSLKPHFS